MHEGLGQLHRYVKHYLAEGLLVLDEAGTVVYVNDTLAGWLGIGQESVDGRHYSELWSEPIPALEQSSLEGQACLRHRDGHLLPVRFAVSSLSLEKGEKHLVSMTNLADVEQFNDALIRTQRLAGIGTMTTSVAHEITNPISVITNTCSNLIYELDSNHLDVGQLRRYIGMIEQSAWRCINIVEALRNYTGTGETETAVTSLNIVIQDALTLVEQQFRKEYNVTIETDLAPDLKSLVCNHNQLTQVLINLLTNACYALQPAGGVIHVRSWTLSQDAGGPAEYAVSVRDGGAGIAPTVMDRIFEPFFTTRPNGQGTGLGLFIVREIVHAHNGRVWAENNPDGGATFTVALPRKQNGD